MRIQIGLAVAATGLLLVQQASAQVVQNGPTVVYSPVTRNVGGQGIDFANAKPLPLPTSSRAPVLSPSDTSKSLALPGPSGYSPGTAGTGQTSPVQLVPAMTGGPQPPQAAPQEFGTSNHVFSTSRVNAYNQPTATFYPFAAAGKLFFNIGSGSYVCSASLIKPGIIVTAAHCVADYGQSTFYTNWQFVPGYNNGSAPYGVWTGQYARVMTSYYNGTDNCAQYGVICPNDIAIITLYTPTGVQPGASTGTFGYGWNNYSFNSSNQVLINQLGYPVALDSGGFMQRNDSQGFVSSANSGNTIIGSLMTGGSSGGPWLVNLGRPPLLSGTSFGTGSDHNVVVGVTSWGYTNSATKEQGASPFTSNNIVVLVNNECAVRPGKC